MNTSRTHRSEKSVEFDAGETVDNYGDVTWWRNFRYHVDHPDCCGPLQPVGFEIEGAKAIIIAPADLDAQHNFSPELHPAWLFMVRVATSPDSEDWAFFVRNWGNKGGCGGDDRQLPLQDILVLLQRPGSVGGFIVQGPPTELAGDNPDVEYITESWLPGQGLVETFHLPPPADHGWIAGYIHVVWRLSAVPLPPPPLVVQVPPEQEMTLAPAEPPLAATIASLVSSMAADQRAGFLKDWQGCNTNLARPAKGPVKIRQGSIPPSPTQSPMGNAVPSLTHPAQCRALALCKAFNNNIPGHAEFCDKLH
jgi:hypothetical protein